MSKNVIPERPRDLGRWKSREAQQEVRSLLDEVFKTPEQEVRYFSELMRTPTKSGPEAAKREGVARIRRGQADKVQPFAPTVHSNGFVDIEHGWDGDDYVWHIQPAQETRRKWRTSIDRVIFACCKAMKPVIPNHVRVNIFQPLADWDLKVITFKAHALRSCWNVTDADVRRLTVSLLQVLQPLV